MSPAIVAALRSISCIPLIFLTTSSIRTGALSPLPVPSSPVSSQAVIPMTMCMDSGVGEIPMDTMRNLAGWRNNHDDTSQHTCCGHDQHTAEATRGTAFLQSDLG